MKNYIIIFISFLLLSCALKAQDINPYLVDCQILPKPLMPAEFNGTGVVSLIVGNSGSDDMNLVVNQEMKLTITLSYGVPNAANPVDAIGGTWAGYFDWSYNVNDNTFHAIQNQDIPSQVGGVSGTVTILYKVTDNSKISNMNNGFAINIVPPAYAVYNNVLDDSASDFTNVEAYDYGDAPSSYGEAVHLINLYKSGGSYENYVYLGSSVDPEPANQSSEDATGDDDNDSDNDATGGENDEDGVILPTAFVPGEWALIQVNVTIEDGASAYLNGWIDWNGDGTFTDENEEEVVYTSVFVDPPGPPPPYWLTYWYMDVSYSGVYDIWVEVPSDAVIGKTFARFRIGSYDAGNSGSDSYGEVEDYEITINAPAGDVTGHLYIDANGNGAQDAGEPDLAGVDVVVTDSTNGVHTVTSDASGDWIVTVPPGSTSANVDESDPDFPAGCQQTEGSDPTTVIAINGSTVDAGVDGYFISVSIGDCVWLDDNGNGIHDPGEPGISNVVVHLLDGGSVLIDETLTDENGTYLFENLPPADYQIEIVAPSQHVFTVQHSPAATENTDSDVDSTTGLSALTTVILGQTNITVDAGLYVPANVFGYLFIDEDLSLVRDNGDNVITNAAVTLYANGEIAGTVVSDASGFYLFEDVPVGAVSVVVSRANANLVEVPLTGEAAEDERRNRGLPGDNDLAYINLSVSSGYGVLDSLPGETLNFGFTQHPLSTLIDLRVYAVSADKVVVELSTVNENGCDDIVVYARINESWVEVARITEDQIVGFGSNSYTVEAYGLVPGENYLFRVIDESGHIFEGTLTVALSAAAVESVSLTPEMVKIVVRTEYGRFYRVLVCEELGEPWKVEFVKYPTAFGWSELTDQPFMAGPGESTEVLVPRNNRVKAFFKIMITE